MKCLCPPPDYINVPGEHGFTDTILLKGYKFLYGRKATTKCEECGVGLCEDCMTGGEIFDHDWDYAVFYREAILCPSCAEVR